MHAAAPEPIVVSVVIPCLNESATIGSCIKEATLAFERAGLHGEVVVADNGSTDGSREISAASGARVVPVQERGYGSALMGGIAAAQGQFVIMGDADGTYAFSDIPKFVDKLRQGYDLVLGDRFSGDIAESAMPFLHRYLGNPVLSAIGRLFFRTHIRDFHCGLRGFRKDFYARAGLACTGMEFASEMIVKATLLGMKVGEVPTSLRPGPPGRRPHLRTWRDGWRHLRFLLLYSPRWLFLIPGLTLMSVGLGIVGVLLPGPIRMGRVIFDVHTMLYAACMILLGFQIVAFAVFSRIYGETAGLLPAHPVLRSLYDYVTLETGLAVGGSLFAAGVLSTLIAVFHWSNVGFGPLDYERTLRMVIPSALLLTLGIQIVFSSFFLSMLGLKRKTG